MGERLRALGVPIVALVVVIAWSAMVLAVADDDTAVRGWPEDAGEAPSVEPVLEAATAAVASPAARAVEVAPPPPTPPILEVIPKVSPGEYARRLCTATSAFRHRFEEATTNIKPTNAEEAVRELALALGGALEGLTHDIEGARPPEDLAAWHADTLERLRRAADQVRATGRASDLGSYAIVADGPYGKPPPEIEEKLRDAASGVKECQEAGIFI